LIWRREKNCIGHILRGEILLKEVIDGRMIGTRPRGKQRLGMLKEFLKEAPYAELKRQAGKHKRMKNIEAKNLHVPSGRTLTTNNER